MLLVLWGGEVSSTQPSSLDKRRVVTPWCVCVCVQEEAARIAAEKAEEERVLKIREAAWKGNAGEVQNNPPLKSSKQTPKLVCAGIGAPQRDSHTRCLLLRTASVCCAANDQRLLCCERPASLAAKGQGLRWAVGWQVKTHGETEEDREARKKKVRKEPERAEGTHEYECTQCGYTLFVAKGR